MNKLIAFTGKAGAGKSTAAEMFVLMNRYVEESFAKRPKQAVKDLFGLSNAAVFGDKEQKEAVIPHLSQTRPVSGRLLLQTLCTDWGRDMIDPDIWVYPVQAAWDNMKGIPGFAGMVISDLRFDNEAEWVRSQGGLVIEILPTWTRDGGDLEKHVSESGISKHLIDFSVMNTMVSRDAFYNSIVTAIVAHRAEMELKLTVPTVEATLGKEKSISDLIVNWADRVFPSRTITNALQKMVMEEIPEYLMAQDDPLELADVGILLYDIANLAGIDLDKAIREKMAVNEKRTWEIDSVTGLMNHVEEVPMILRPRGQK